MLEFAPAGPVVTGGAAAAGGGDDDGADGVGVNPPIRLFGSDGKTHLEYDLILQSMFNAPVTVTSIEVLAPDGASLLKLDGDQVAKFTTPAFTGPPTAVVPPSGALGTVIDVVVPPDNVPDQLNHRISYRPGTSELGSIVGTRDIVGPELDVDPRAPIVIASPLKGQAWLNANSCCVPESPHRSGPNRGGRQQRQEVRGVRHRLGAAA